MKLELVSFALCPYVHRTTTLLHEKGVPFDIRYIDLANKPDWFLALSPRGKVPVLVVDGEPIFESAVINELLDELLPPRMLPEDPLARARERAWIVLADDVFAAQYKLFSAQTKQEWDAARAALEDPRGPLGRFEQAVKGPFFAGERFGLVDAAVAPAFHRFAYVEAHSPLHLAARLPKVTAWGKRLATRASVRAGVLPEWEALYGESLRRKGAYLGREVLSAA